MLPASICVSQVGKFERVASQEREDFPRFRYLFESGELLPPAVFMQALELGAYESLGSYHLRE